MPDSLIVGGKKVPRGQRARIDIPVGRMATHVMVTLPVRVIHGAEDGPRLFLTAAIHGDEINGVEIIRRALADLEPADLKGSIVAAPIVNIFGFSTHSRYMPDRRDLNRSFPGSRKGSLAARLASLVMSEIVAPCSHGIDLHTAAAGRMNLPHVRANLDDPEARRCAVAFGAPIMISSQGPGGSLRLAAGKQGKHLVVYEAGEVLRYNPFAIDAGVAGVERVMVELGMIAPPPVGQESPAPVESQRQRWVRAPRGGIVHIEADLGAKVVRRQPPGVVSDPMGEKEYAVRSPGDGYVIGVTTNPLVNRGDAVLHIAMVDPPADSGPGRPEPSRGGAEDGSELPDFSAAADAAAEGLDPFSAAADVAAEGLEPFASSSDAAGDEPER